MKGNDMSNETLEGIARRLVEHPRFDHEAALQARWVPPVVPDGAAVGQALTYNLDLTNWATVGVLLGMLAETYAHGFSLHRYTQGTWGCEGPHHSVRDAPGAAVALALLEAWA